MTEHDSYHGIIQKAITALETKIDNLDTKISRLTENRFNDTISIKDIIRDEVKSLEHKIDTNIDKMDKRVGLLENFKSEVNAKIAVSVLGVTAVFAIISVLLNKLF